MNKILPFIIAGIIILITIIASIVVLNIPKEEQETIAQIKEGKYENFIVNEAGETIVVEIEEVEEATEEELEPIDEEKIKQAAEKTVSTDMYYYIEVNCTAQVVTVYKKDENNEYTIPVKAMICSTGSSTPQSGVYKMPGRRSRWRDLYGGVSGQYVTNIVGAILFHSVPYTCKAREQDNSSLEYWEYDKLGTDASMGCVRLTVRDAKWIYENCGAGTQVEFYNDSNPGPLGRPSAKKISSYPDELRNWDPTDPDEDNPWHTYTEEQNKTPENNTTIEAKQVQNEIKNENILNEVNNSEKNTNTTDTKNLADNTNATNNNELIVENITETSNDTKIEGNGNNIIEETQNNKTENNQEGSLEEESDNTDGEKTEPSKIENNIGNNTI